MRNLLFIIVIGTFLLYFPVEARKKTERLIKLPLDARIPLIPIFVIPYVIFFPYVFGTVLGSYLSGDPGFNILAAALIIVSLITSLIYLEFPSAIMRPAFRATGELLRIIKFIQKVDSPNNVFPSNHVAYSLVTTIYLSSALPQFAPLFWLCFVFIGASTVFIKQHYIIDVPAGALVALLAWFAAGRLL